MTEPWKPEPMRRLEREREGLVKKRDELQKDVTNYNGAIYKLDAQIKEWQEKISGPQSAGNDFSE